jgi:hypothetical protein
MKPDAPQGRQRSRKLLAARLGGGVITVAAISLFPACNLVVACEPGQDPKKDQCQQLDGGQYTGADAAATKPAPAADAVGAGLNDGARNLGGK